MSKKVVIIGGEGNGGVIASCIEDNRDRYNDYEWEVIGFVNDYETEVCGYPVLCKMDGIQNLLETTDYYFMWGIHTIGRNKLIEKAFERANIPDERWAIVVHKSAFVAKSAILEPGVFVMANAYVGPQAKVGKCSLLMANSIYGHNTVCGPLCHFSVGSITSSYDTIGKCASVAFGTVVLEKKTMGDYSVAGAHSLITHNIPDNEIWIGSPARFMKVIREVENYIE